MLGMVLRARDKQEKKKETNLGHALMEMIV